MSYRPNHVLAAIDLSAEESGADLIQATLDTASALAGAFQAKVTLLYVGAPLPPGAGIDFSDELKTTLQRAEVARVEAFETQLEQHAARLRDAGLTVETRVVVEPGLAANSICRIAESVNADQIVIASHGRKGVRRFLLGSVAERVAHLAKCPVMLVKASE